MSRRVFFLKWGTSFYYSLYDMALSAWALTKVSFQKVTMKKIEYFSVKKRAREKEKGAKVNDG